MRTELGMPSDLHGGGGPEESDVGEASHWNHRERERDILYFAALPPGRNDAKCFVAAALSDQISP